MEIKKKVAFTYDDWPRLFNHLYRQSRYYEKIYDLPSWRRSTTARVERHHNRLTRHTNWMISRQVPNWKSYQMFYGSRWRCGDRYEKSCLVVEV